jgi:hypothetical protein
MSQENTDINKYLTVVCRFKNNTEVNFSGLMIENSHTLNFIFFVTSCLVLTSSDVAELLQG